MQDMPARVLADDDRLVILIICSVYSGRGVMVLMCVAVLPHGKCVTHQHINTHWELSGADTADQLMEYLGHSLAVWPSLSFPARTGPGSARAERREKISIVITDHMHRSDGLSGRAIDRTSHSSADLI